MADKKDAAQVSMSPVGDQVSSDSFAGSPSKASPQLSYAEGSVDPDALRIIDIPDGKWKRRYRSVGFQMFLLAALSFSGPSMASAITLLGGGGQATPFTANAASCTQYAVSAVVAMFGGPIIARIGIRGACLIGAIGFPLSGAGFYVLSKYKISWFIILAKGIYGFTSSFLYVAESSAMISYPEQHRRGIYLSLWLCARVSGATISGAVALALNFQGSGVGAVSTNTYLVFIVLECIGVPMALMLSHSRDVIRSDGYGVPLLPPTDWTTEMKNVLKHHLQRRTLLMIPVYIFTFYGDGPFFTYLGVHFSVRARALSSFLAPLSVIVLNPLFGLLLDFKKWGPRKRAQAGFVVYMLAAVIMASWAMGMTSWFFGQDSALRLDFLLQPGQWIVAYIPFWMYYLFSYLGQSLVYWVLGQFASDVQTNARVGGVFRSWETVGQAISYGIDSTSTSPWINMSIVTALTAISIPCMWMVVQQVPVEEKVHQIANSDGFVMGSKPVESEDVEDGKR